MGIATTTFEDRIKRIEANAPIVDHRAGVPTGRHKVKLRRRPKARDNLISLATGSGLGLLMAILVIGAVRPDTPWGPGTQYSEILSMIGLGGLLLSLPMVLLSVYMRSKRPGFFFFSVGYCVAALLPVII